MRRLVRHPQLQHSTSRKLLMRKPRAMVRLPIPRSLRDVHVLRRPILRNHRERLSVSQTNRRARKRRRANQVNILRRHRKEAHPVEHVERSHRARVIISGQTRKP